jgi:enoyl-CoA hydratase/carnithine racemase
MAVIPAEASVLAVVADGVAVLTLNRPSLGNALSADMVESVLETVDRLAVDVTVHTLVLRGEGRHFCTGFDLTGLEDETDASLLARMVRIEMMFDMIWRAPLRTVAIGQGRITGAGADLFTVCDHRFLAQDATLRFPGAGFGLVLGTRRLSCRIGTDQAIRIVSEGIVLDSTSAMVTKLATAILPPLGRPWRDLPPPTVSRATFVTLRNALDDGRSDSDLAALVRSAARPGLKSRILEYRATQNGAYDRYAPTASSATAVRG